jgi:hypothetical protein
MTDNIHTAINAVMQEVEYVQKQKSGGLNYSFASEAALIAAVRPAMVKNGVYMSVAGIKDIVRGTYTTGKGYVMQMVDLTAIVRFTHAPSDTHIDVEVLGSGADAGDKASNKALTGAYKYSLRQTFCIETGDDPDREASEPRGKVKVDQSTGEIKASNGNGHKEQAPQAPAPKFGEMASQADRAENAAVLQAGQSSDPKSVTLAKMGKLSPANIKEWQDGCKKIAARFPKYQTGLKDGETSGVVNYHHILGAAAKCNYSVVDDTNFQNVIEDIARRAAAIS